MSDSYKVYASKDYVDSKALPEGASAYQQLVTDGEGNTKWEDKPFGESAIKTVLLEEQSLTFDTDSSSVRVGFYPTKADEVIHVKWDGIEYVCTSFYWNMSMSFAWGNPAAGGNYEASSANEPFLIVDSVIDAKSAGTYVVEIWKEEIGVKTIDPKYLPEHSHNWDQIEDKPEMFSGSWNDLKDRPFYDDGTTETLVGTAQAEWGKGGRPIGNLFTESGEPADPLQGGKSYRIVGTVTRYGADIPLDAVFVRNSDGSVNYIPLEYDGNIFYVGYEDTSVKVYNDIGMPTSSAGAMDISVYLYEANILQLPEKYIPDTIARITDIPTNVSEFTNDIGYLTEHQDLSEYAKINDCASAYIELPIPYGDNLNWIFLNTTEWKYDEDSPYCTSNAIPILPNYKKIKISGNNSSTIIDTYLMFSESDIIEEGRKNIQLVGSSNTSIEAEIPTGAKFLFIQTEDNTWSELKLTVLSEDVLGIITTEVARQKILNEDMVTISSTAQVGQTIVVKSVDENGKPTEWEAVDIERPSMTQVTLTTTNWDDTTKSQTITVTGILADTTAQNIQVNPIPTSMHYAVESGLYCSAQAENSLTFSCSVIPTENITLNIVWQDVNYIS